MVYLQSILLQSKLTMNKLLIYQSMKLSVKIQHIDVKYHLVRDHAQSGNVTLIHTSTNETFADSLTKPLKRIKFSYFRDGMGIFGKAHF